MLRDKSLIPLSHQHQHALALCVRLDRAIQAGEIDREAWQVEIQQIVEQEIAIHFAAEEKLVFPAAEEFPEFKALVNELRTEHGILRDFFTRAAARALNGDELRSFASTLSAHVRKEERQLFEGLQQRLDAQQRSALGVALGQALAAAPEACILPSEATRLRPRQK